MCVDCSRGSALLDVVIALAVLGLSGVSLITLLGQTAQSMRNVRNTERSVRQASDELGRFAVYDRTQLASMLGQSMSHGWVVVVASPAADLFDVAVAERDNTDPLLRTTFYRPDTVHAITP